MHEVLGWEPWSKQTEILHSLRDNKETYVKSCNGAGKSWLAAGIVIWWLFTRRGKVVTTAPTWRQVREILWANIGAQCERAPQLGIRPLQTRMQLASDWFAVGLSTKVPDKFQGYHTNVLIVIDEASGVNDENIWTAIDGNLTDQKHDRLLAIGNPLDPESVFARKFKIPKQKGITNKITISAFDTPNVKMNESVIPGMITKGWVEQKMFEWGEDSPMYQARVLGEFPKVGMAALFPLHWMERAFNYSTDGHWEPVVDGEMEWIEGYPDLSVGPASIGLDVAGSGMDNNAMCYFTGKKLQDIAGWAGLDSSEILGDDGEEYKHPTLFEWVKMYRPDVAIIDALGLGDPIYRYAQKHMKNNKDKYPNFRVRGFKASNSALRDKKFANWKAESYWYMRTLLQENNLDLSNVNPIMKETLLTQSNAIRWKIQPASGLIQIEDKETMRRREGFSPDELESIIMALAGSKKMHLDKDMTSTFEYNGTDSEMSGVASFEYDLMAYMR
jgi:hypothetical protein